MEGVGGNVLNILCMYEYYHRSLLSLSIGLQWKRDFTEITIIYLRRRGRFHSKTVHILLICLNI